MTASLRSKITHREASLTALVSEWAGLVISGAPSPGYEQRARELRTAIRRRRRELIRLRDLYRQHRAALNAKAAEILNRVTA